MRAVTGNDITVTPSRGDVFEDLGTTKEAILRVILRRIAGPYNDHLYVGKNYTLANLEEDLRHYLGEGER